MLFTEFRYFAFFALVFAVFWTLRGNGVRKRWLLVCSYAFYSAWNWKLCSLIAISTLLGRGPSFKNVLGSPHLSVWLHDCFPRW